MPASNETSQPQPITRPVQFLLCDEIEEIEAIGKQKAVEYPKLVAAGKITQDDADFHLGRLRSALRRLKALELLVSNIALPF